MQILHFWKGLNAFSCKHEDLRIILEHRKPTNWTSLLYIHPMFCTMSQKSSWYQFAMSLNLYLVLIPAQHCSLTEGKATALMQLSRSHAEDPAKELMGSKKQENMAALGLITFFLLDLFLEGIHSHDLSIHSCQDNGALSFQFLLLSCKTHSKVQQDNSQGGWKLQSLLVVG